MHPHRQHKFVSIAVGSRAHDNDKPSNLDEFLVEAARRGEKVLGFEMRRGSTGELVWDIKVMVRR